MGEDFRVYNTLSRREEAFEALEPGRIKLYACGMTVYDHSHVGHARAMVTFDTVVRYLRHRGWTVDYVRNYTDVDDKIIARAEALGEAPLALAERFIQSFREDMDALGQIAPDHEPRVSECMDDIIAMIGRLEERGHAYPSQGSVWFSVKSFEDYGKLSGQRPDDMRESPETQSGKRDRRDFALWKAAKPGEPAWDSPWGKGRPGWHIECSAMVAKHLGERIDIHGGGIDLVFPHHENEIAQSECAHGCAPYARYWMHNGMLTVESGRKVKGPPGGAAGGAEGGAQSEAPSETKMGKSLGNVFTIKDALARFPAEALRMYYLQVHYRSPLPWNVSALPNALGLLNRLYEAKEVAQKQRGEEPPEKVAHELGADAQRALELANDFASRFHAAMDHDFNTAKALGITFELARAFNRFSNHKKAAKRGGPIAARVLDAFRLVEDAFGILALEPEVFFDEVKAKRLPALGLSSEAVQAKLEDRRAARSAKDWARADDIRAELDRIGIQVMDRPDGVDWRIRLDAAEARVPFEASPGE